MHNCTYNTRHMSKSCAPPIVRAVQIISISRPDTNYTGCQSFQVNTSLYKYPIHLWCHFDSNLITTQIRSGDQLEIYLNHYFFKGKSIKIEEADVKSLETHKIVQHDNKSPWIFFLSSWYVSASSAAFKLLDQFKIIVINSQFLKCLKTKRECYFIH